MTISLFAMNDEIIVSDPNVPIDIASNGFLGAIAITLFLKNYKIYLFE